MEGIDILLTGYDSNSIIYPTLQHYKRLFESALQGEKAEIDEFKKESPLLEHLKTFWDENELDIIYKKFIYIDELEDEIKDGIDPFSIINGLMDINWKLMVLQH